MNMDKKTKIEYVVKGICLLILLGLVLYYS